MTKAELQTELLACPLCSHTSEWLCEDRRRCFYHCSECQLIFAEPTSHLPDSEEKAIYDLHNNDPDDPRYREFLNQLARPLLKKLQPGMEGLDFGCGPSPLLSDILNQAGMVMSHYDPYYAPDAQHLKRQYDFVTCTEVVEHFNTPKQSWLDLITLVKPEGWLGIMTYLVPDTSPDEFRRWGYKGDPTHVSFYQPETLHWIGQQFAMDIEIVSDRVILLRKQG